MCLQAGPVYRPEEPDDSASVFLSLATPRKAARQPSHPPGPQTSREAVDKLHRGADRSGRVLGTRDACEAAGVCRACGSPGGAGTCTSPGQSPRPSPPGFRTRPSQQQVFCKMCGRHSCFQGRFFLSGTPPVLFSQVPARFNQVLSCRHLVCQHHPLYVASSLGSQRRRRRQRSDSTAVGEAPPLRNTPSLPAVISHGQ